MPAPGPNPIVNQQFLSDDGIWNFSDQADNVNLNNFSESYGQRTRMWGGNDFVVASSFNAAGWDNIVNGNLGSDTLGSSNNGSGSREYFLGGKEIDVLYGYSGADWLNGNNDQDSVYGGNDNDIVRGGKGDDNLFGEGGNDILIGDFGTDFLYANGGGSDRLVLRTDAATIDGIFYNNVSGNPAEADRIFNFDGNDKIIIPGVTSFSQLKFFNDNIGGNGVLIAADLNFDGADEYIGFVLGFTAAQFNANPGYVVVGQTAQSFYDGISPDSFLGNPEYWSTV